MKKSLLILSLFATVAAHAQPETSADPATPSSNYYWKSASELIFSFDNMDAFTGVSGSKAIDVTPIMRFSGFFHFGQQFHADFGQHTGIWTGIGVRNVGMINKLDDSIKVKQRVYSLGVPLAFKIGNVQDGFYVSLGGEFEFFFHYKQKVFYEDVKRKKSEWVSDKVNLFNPSAFVDINFPKGAYIRFKYYLLDFLTTDKQEISLNGNPYIYRPETSQLFYVGIGSTIKRPKSHHMRTRSTDTRAAIY